jgi:hypothetical protein
MMLGGGGGGGDVNKGIGKKDNDETGKVIKLLIF